MELNEIKKLIREGKGSEVTKLDLSDNQLTSLPPEIAELKNLTNLHIGANQLTSLPPKIAELENLIYLNIGANQLTSLPPEIAELKNLTYLNITRNQLTSLPPEILKLSLDIIWEYASEGNGIFLEGNPFENPPIEIIKRGREAIFNYFKSLEGEQKPLNEVKVLLVGEGGAGKTSLVRRLFGEEVDGNEPQTPGINVRKWAFKNGQREIEANLWDFGGQEIMHATHQFFLSKRSLYILLLDGRKDEKPEYWLKLIGNFGGDSPILVVMNKIDENPGYELNRKFLKEKYPSIRAFCRLSCTSNEGVEEFSRILREELTKVKHLEIKWPESWFNVKNRLEKMRPTYTSYFAFDNKAEHHNFIQFNEYKIMCNEEGIKNESEQNTLVDFLHDLGVILHFKDIPLLNTYVLEPEWVTNVVYKLINSKEIAESRGILKLDTFAKILKQSSGRDFYCPPDQYIFFIGLMNKFELSYDLDKSTLLFPNLLEIQEPNFEFDYEGALKFVINYDFLPPSVMPRFIVKVNRDIKDNLRWRTGVVLLNEKFNSSAVVKADIEAKRINIYVNGEQKRDYFASILQKLREINSSFEKLEVTERIPLPDNPEVTVSYDHLLKLEFRGIKKYMPEGSDKDYVVSDLLGTVNNESIERVLMEDRLKDNKMVYVQSGQNKEETNTVSILFLAADPLAADPTNPSHLRIDKEFREIKAQLQLSNLRDKFRLVPYFSVRPPDISQALLDTKPQIVHFSGHGIPTGALCFENLVGEIHPIEPDALAALFEQFSNQVDCVVLNACYAKIQAEAISKHIQYVIGMNQAIGDKAAIAFAVGFYQALGGGCSIEAACELGRIQIRLRNIPGHLTPVLIKDGVVVKIDSLQNNLSVL